MIFYDDYIEYKVHNEIDYIKDLIAEGYFEDSKVENATDEQIEEVARKVISGLEDNDYLNEVLCQCEQDEIKYQIEEKFGKKLDIEKWAKEIYLKYDKDTTAYSACHNRVMIVFDTTTKRVGFATCQNGDRFNYIVGVAIAYCKLRNLPIPKEIFE